MRLNAVYASFVLLRSSSATLAAVPDFAGCVCPHLWELPHYIVNTAHIDTTSKAAGRNCRNERS